MMKTIRQGDVQFIRVTEIPQEAKPKEGKVLFQGEATGHAHRVDIGELFEIKGGDLYLRTDKVTHVSHDEHKTVTLQPGIFLVVQKRRYDPNVGWGAVGD